MTLNVVVANNSMGTVKERTAPSRSRCELQEGVAPRQVEPDLNRRSGRAARVGSEPLVRSPHRQRRGVAPVHPLDAMDGKIEIQFQRDVRAFEGRSEMQLP